MSDDTTMRFKADISQLKAAMQQASRSIKVANSEFKAATAGMNNWSASASGLQAKLKQLNTVLSAQKRQLSLAEQELEKTRKVYGENSAETDRARIKVNNYQAAVSKTEANLNKYEKELDDVKNGLKETGEAAEKSGKDAQKGSEGFTVMKGALASLVASGVRLAITGLQRLGSEIIDVGKQSIEAYADYEQLKGGVETLFGAGGKSLEEYAKSVGKSVDEVKGKYNQLMSGQETVLKNADKAFKTAGLSANDYMETVTSFSASLLQGLGGDTVKAAKYADMAVVDMADNANKMGTSMTDIQNAYQGFAKDNYTMLDNLKLGYGGTQSEMARLVNESGVMGKSFTATAKNVKDIPFDKLIEAIHKTQSEMGITGTTSKEASETIQGSVNSTKAAWENLLTGLADDNADIDKLWDDFVDSAGTAFDNIFPRVKTLVGNVTDFIKAKVQENFPELYKNADTILTVIKGIGIAIASAFMINKIATFVSSVKTLTSLFTGLKTAVLGSTAAMTAAEGATLNVTAATKLLGMATAALPWVALAAGVAAVTAAFVTYAADAKKAAMAEYELSAAQKKTVEAAKESKKTYDETNKSRDESVQSSVAEYNHASQLVSEYNTLINANGKVKKGYEDRANFIIDELASALGVERSEIEKNIGANGRLKSSINNVIKAKQAEAALQADEQGYQDALKNRGKALKDYQNALDTLDSAESKYHQTQKESGDVMSKYNQLLATNSEAADRYYRSNRSIIEANNTAKESYEKAKKGVADAEAAYTGYNQTIENHEGLAAAIISGDNKKIASALTNLQNNFVTARNGTKATLQKQVKDYEANYQSVKRAVDAGMAGVTQADVKAAKAMVDKAKKELDKLPDEAKKSGKKAGDEHAKGLSGTSGKNKKAGSKVGKAGVTGEKAGDKNSKKTGKKAGDDHAKGLSGTRGKNKTAGSNVGKAANNGAKSGGSGMHKSGSTAGGKYASGVGSKAGSAKSAGGKLGKNAKSGADSYKGSANTSGTNFAQGFINGIGSLVSNAFNKAKELAQNAWKGLKKGQDEGSPSKLTYKSGVYFVQGYINGIASMQKSLVSTVQGMVSNVIGELGKMKGFNFAVVADNATKLFSNNISNSIEYLLAKIQYQNDNKIKEFDRTIKAYENKQKAKEDLQKKIKDAKKRIDKLEDKKKLSKSEKKELNRLKANLKKYKKELKKYGQDYKKLISEQQKSKDAYQAASAQMLSEFQKALNDYQQKAQELIDSTINGITEKYNQRYDELINKQDTLIDKLKSAGDLFEISGAGVISINDIKEQTKQINDYAEKLKAIKEKVSAELFDQIVSYDMQEGSAFIDQLLSMSAKDLDAYNKAYTEKMQAAQKAGEDIYKADFDKIASDYKKEINTAFKGLDKQLKTLGEQCMKGFVNGLTKNTDYMSKNIKTFVKAMVDEFKKDLKIKSPSKVMFEIGEYTGEGFDQGLMSIVKSVQDTAGKIAGAVSSPLNDFGTNLGMVKSAVGSSVNGMNSNSVVNNYNLVQNNTSPKPLSALETYQARRRQIAMMKAATGN